MTAGSGAAGGDIVVSWQAIVDGAARTQQRALGRVEETGLPGVWFEALYTLLHSEEHRLPMNRLAQNLLMTAGGFTKLADRMARAGLIDRRNSEGDRRVVYAALTDEGLRVAEQGEDIYRRALEESVLGVIGPEAVEQVAQSMQRLRSTHNLPMPAESVIDRRDPGLPDRRQPSEGGRRLRDSNPGGD